MIAMLAAIFWSVVFICVFLYIFVVVACGVSRELRVREGERMFMSGILYGTHDMIKLQHIAKFRACTESRFSSLMVEMACKVIQTYYEWMSNNNGTQVTMKHVYILSHIKLGKCHTVYKTTIFSFLFFVSLIFILFSCRVHILWSCESMSGAPEKAQCKQAK